MNFIRPCEGRITSFYGRRLHPIKKIMEGHHGIDIAASGTVPIFATASGTVSRVQPDKTFGTYGNMVTIKHANGWESLYGHLSRYIVKRGQEVKQGQVIGYMGNTGGSTGQHLHFELHKGGWNNAYTNEVNPLLYYVDPDVKRLQQLLVDAGQKITADGRFGPATENAVKVFQKSAGLSVDGSAGPATLAALEKEEEELKFSSPALKSETETSLLSKAHRQIIVDAAIKSGAHKSWADKLTNDTLTDADILGLAVKYTVAVNKEQVL